MRRRTQSTRSPLGRSAARAARVLVPVLAAVLLLAGCTNAPPPPLVTSNVASTKPATKPNLRQAVVGLDSVKGGYNPHVLADRSTVTTALSSLLLPSVFRHGADGTLRLDRSVMASAKVTKADPFTVTYHVRSDASWSDGVPIAVEDFLYLRNQMATQPGVTDPAGYRLISDISGSASGKVVTVSFSKPYPGWRSLFRNLLPAHLLKDAPGGWQGALAHDFPAVAGPYEVRSIDPARNEIVLERNARYWGTPAELDRIVFRKAAPQALVHALGNGDDQLASFGADAQTLAALRHLGAHVSVSTVPRPRELRMLLRPGSATLGDDTVRDAVAAALDRDALIAAAQAHAQGSLRADAFARAPSQPEYRPTLPADAPIARTDPSAVVALLGKAGYTHVDGKWLKDGKPLTLTIAAPKGSPALVRLARLARRQLAEQDIAAKVVTPDPNTLFGTQLAGGKQATGGGKGGSGPDIAFLAAPVLADGAAALAAEFGCSTQSLGGKPSAPTPPNPSGFCDSAVQHRIDAALTGEAALPDVVAELEPSLWRESVVVPLVQSADALGVRKEVAGVRAGPPLRTPFPSGAHWRLTR